MLSCVAPNVACIWGKATFAIVESSTCISVPAITAMVSSPLCLTFNGANSAAGVADIDLHLSAHASNERACGFAVDGDANRNALRYLHPVSIGVLCRNDRLFGSRTCRNAFDFPPHLPFRTGSQPDL